jgi:hypothetical protein
MSKKKSIDEGNQLRIIKDNNPIIPPKPKMVSEDRIQQECYLWFHNTYPKLRGLLFAVPNGGSRSIIEAKKFKLTGVVPGVSDMLFMYAGKTYCLELKTEKGYQSKKQKIWQDTVTKQGFIYLIVRDLNVFKDIIETILNNN